MEMFEEWVKNTVNEAMEKLNNDIREIEKELFYERLAELIYEYYGL